MLTLAGGFLLGVVLIVVLGGVVHDHTRIVVHNHTVTRTVTAPSALGQGEVAVPDVVGASLDTAEQRLSDAGLDDAVHGGGAFGVLDPSAWVVTAQDPRAGSKVPLATTVDLDIDRG